ncbi:uncharacterized protein TNCV_4122701 [Trichonephila clavipes]|nr:uncharacterized protein TNCV_4122701 [Trichonephila clavipes]
MGDETYIPFFDVPTRQESKICVFEDYPTLIMLKGQRAMNKLMYAIFFRSMGLVRVIKLKGQKTVTRNWCTTKCPPEILQEMNAWRIMYALGTMTMHLPILPD